MFRGDKVDGAKNSPSAGICQDLELSRQSGATPLIDLSAPLPKSGTILRRNQACSPCITRVQKLGPPCEPLPKLRDPKSLRAISGYFTAPYDLFSSASLQLD